MDILVTLIIVLLVIGAGFALFAFFVVRPLVQRLMLRQAQKAKITERDPLLEQLEPGKQAILYFTSPGCGPCKLVQAPVLQQLGAELSDSLQIIKIDITEQFEAAQRWGVMRVPRTFILDHNHHVYATNMDVTLLATLKQQLAEAEEYAAHPMPMKVIAPAKATPPQTV